MTDIRERLLQAFAVEHRDYLAGIRERLERSGPAGRLPSDDLDEAFRQAHSLKGAARAVNVAPVERLAERIESAFERIRSGAEELGPDLARCVRRALDLVEDCVAALNGGTRAPVIEPFLGEFDALLGRAPPVAAAGEPPVAKPKSGGPPAPGSARVDVGQLDRVIRVAGELLNEVRSADSTAALADLNRELGGLEAAWQRLRRDLRTAAPTLLDGAALAIVFEDLDQRLRRAVRVGRAARWREAQSARAVQQTARSLEGELGAVRMASADSIFGGIGVLARDLAMDAGVNLEIEVSGLEARADRQVLQRLKDPVLHLLRNAISHGIEPAEERVARGKPAAGRIDVAFRVAGGLLTASIADDGRGIDLARVHAAAERLRLLPRDAERPSERDLLNLVFAPGFTTREEVGPLSGRGMGLSAVSDAVSRLGGSVAVRNREGAGAEFRLDVPVAATAQTLLLLGAGDRIYAVASDAVAKLHRARIDEIATVGGRPVIRIGDQSIRVASLTALLGIAEADVRSSRSVVPMVVLRSPDRPLAVACDEFLGLRQGLVKDLGLSVAGSAIAGGVVLEDGRIALVLNRFTLLNSVHRDQSVRFVERASARQTPAILVVDDSLTTRTLEKSILEAHGYEVRLAVDGVHALKRLRAEPIDLVIADVQMPHLDGFGLLAAIKEDPALARVPVVLVTSLERREDRARGLALGADAYIVKRKFDQEELLATIGRLV